MTPRSEVGSPPSRRLTGRELVRLVHLEQVVAIAFFIGGMGALSTHAPLDWGVYPLIVVVLALSTIAVFVGNDVFDAPFDQLNRRRRSHVHVTGRAGIPTLSAVSIGSGLIALGLSAVVASKATVWIVVYLGVGLVYNVAHKRLPGAPLYDYMAGAGLAATVGYGASATAGITDVTVGLMVYATFVFAVNNGVFGDVYDLRSDIAGGARSTPRALGVTVTDDGVDFSGLFWSYSVILHLLMAGSILITASLVESRLIMAATTLVQLVLIVMMVVWLVTYQRRGVPDRRILRWQNSIGILPMAIVVAPDGPALVVVLVAMVTVIPFWVWRR